MTPDEQTTALIAIVDALIEGLRTPHRDLNDQAVLALARIGPSVVPPLHSVAAWPKTRPGHRERLLRVASWISQNGQQPGNAAAAVTDCLVDSLRLSDQTLNAKAADACCHLGAAIVDRLVIEACRNQRHPGYRVRLLGVVEQIGISPSADAYFDLYLLGAHHDPQIKIAAHRALFSVRPLKNANSSFG